MLRDRLDFVEYFGDIVYTSLVACKQLLLVVKLLEVEWLSAVPHHFIIHVLDPTQLALLLLQHPFHLGVKLILLQIKCSQVVHNLF
jgi:hypothetical protein